MHQRVDGSDLKVERHYHASSIFGGKVGFHLTENPLKHGLIWKPIRGNVKVEQNDALVGKAAIQERGPVEFEFVVLHKEGKR